MEIICILFPIVIFLSAQVYAYKEGPIFPMDRELLYSFSGDVSTGVTEPAAALSHFGIKAKLRVHSTIDKIIFKLEDVNHSAYNGAGTNSKLPAHEFDFIQVPTETDEAISKPFTATYKNGYITNFEVESSDSVWSKNFKRALVSQFQLKLETKRGTAFITTESGIAGECKVNNLATYNHKLKQLELRKFSDMSNCSKFIHEIQFTSNICQDKNKNSATGSTERHYKIKHEDGANVINSINSRGGIAFQLFGEFGELQYQVTRQELKRLSLEAVTSPLAMTEPVTTSLTFEIPPPVAEGADYDYTFGRMKRNQDETVNYILKTLSSYTSKFYSEADGYQKHEDLHNMDFYRIIGMMRQLGRESILQAAEKVLLGTNYVEETARSIFIDLLSKVGTRASIQTSYDLLNEGKVVGMRATSLLNSLPFYLRQPSIEMIKDGEILLNLGDKVKHGLQKNAVLTFATLVNRVCKAVTCKPALVADYVNILYEELVNESNSYSDQMLYIHALGNIGTETVVDYLEPLIQGKLKYSHQLRYRAIEATKLALKSQPDKVNRIYWPILANINEHLELRISALNMLLSSQPTTETFMNILWFMSAEKNNHLYNFYYSTVQSLIDTTYPCYMHLTPGAAKLARLLPKPQTKTYFTNNRIVDYTNPKYGVSSLVNIFSIADEVIGFPNVISVNMLSNSFGFLSGEYSVHIRVDGVYYAMRKKVFGKHADDPVYQLENILETLKVKPRTNKPIHVEYVVQKQGQTIMSLYIDRSSGWKIRAAFDSLMMEILRKNIHTYQYINQAIMKETLYSSDIGIGVNVEQIAPYIITFHTNTTFDNEIKNKFRHFSMNTRYNLQMNFNLRNYNPFGNMLQGVYRSYSYDIKFPLAADLDHEKEALILRSNWEPKKQPINFQLHAKSEAFIAGTYSKNILSQTCPKCISIFLATKGENYRRNKKLIKKKIMSSEMEFEVNLFDCEEENMLENTKELFKSFFCPNGKNSRGLSKEVSPLLLDLIPTYESIIFPLKGSCGFSVKAISVENVSKAEFVLKIEKDKKNWVLPRFLFNLRTPSGDLIKSWDTNFVLDVTEEKETHVAIKAKILRRAPNEPFYLTCVKLENTYPKTKSPWYILYDKQVRETRHNLAIEFGETTDSSKCPSEDSTEIQISGTSRTQVLDPSTWSMAQCEKDRGDHKLYPASGACEAAIVEANIFKNFTFNIKQNKVSPEIKSMMEYVNTLQNMFTFEVIEIPKDFTINIKNTQTSDKFEIHIASKEHGLVDYTPIFSEPLSTAMTMIMSTEAFFQRATKHLSMIYPQTRIPNIVVGTDSICAVAGSKLLSFNNATMDWPISTKYKLLSSQCTEKSTPIYGIFANNPEGSESVNLNIHILDYVIDIKQNANNVPLVQVNGIELNKDGTFEERTLEINITRPHLDTVEIYQWRLELYIVYSYTGVTIFLPDSLRHDVCGLCGLTEHVPYSGPEGSLDDLNQLIEAYTLN